MKQIYTLIIAILLSSTSFATSIVAKSANGKWSVANNWNLNRSPKDRDTVVIPSGINFKVDLNESLDDVVLIVRGTLTFTNGKLRLDRDSRVIVEVGGRITGNGNNDQISIVNTFVYRGSQPDIIGFAMADITTGNGFLGFLLPVQFLSFNAVKSASAVNVTWSTSNEFNNNYFEVQKSVDGRTWNRVGTVPAAITTSDVNNYKFTDLNVASASAFYRVMQVDLNGKSAYTKVIAVQGNASAASRMYKSGADLVVEFAAIPASDVQIRILSLNGQLISAHKLKSAGSKLMLPVSSGTKGMCVVQVIHNNQQQAEKILL